MEKPAGSNSDVCAHPQVRFIRRWCRERLQDVPDAHQEVEEAVKQCRAPLHPDGSTLLRSRRSARWVAGLRGRPRARGKHCIRYAAKSTRCEQWEHGPAAEKVGKTHPCSDVLVESLVAREQDRHGQRREQDALFVHLVAEEKEPPSRGREGQQAAGSYEGGGRESGSEERWTRNVAPSAARWSSAGGYSEA